MPARWAIPLLILATALLRLALAAALGPGNDEAYYFLYTRYPAWSYLDHPPGIAWVGQLGLLLAGHHHLAPLAWRLGFVLTGALSALLLVRLTKHLFTERAALLALIAWVATGYLGWISATFALPDGPLLAAWLLLLDALARAFQRPERLHFWFLAGVAWGLALLCKYHALLFPLGLGLYALITPRGPARPWWRYPGPWVSLITGLLLFAPVLAWNAAHDWASFSFQGRRALATGWPWPRPDRLALFLAGQALYLLPWMWVFLLAVLGRRLRLPDRRSSGFDPSRFLLAMALPVLVAFLVVGSVQPVLPHWSLVGFVPLYPLLGADWEALGQARPRRLAVRVSLVLALPLAIVAAGASLARAGLLPNELNPTSDLAGWDRVAARLDRDGWLDRPGTFLFTSHWYDSGQLAFALAARRGRSAGPPVLCYSGSDARGFADWSRPTDWLGLDGLLLTVEPSSTEPQVYDRYFQSIRPVGSIDLTRDGQPLRRLRLSLGQHQRLPFPFDRSPHSATARPSSIPHDR